MHGRERKMTSDEFASIRYDLKLTIPQTAILLGRLGLYAYKHIRSIESGKRIARPAEALLMVAYRNGYRPINWPPVEKLLGDQQE